MILNTQRFLTGGFSALGLATLVACGGSTGGSGGGGIVQTCWNGSTVVVDDSSIAYGAMCPAYTRTVAALAAPAVTDITAMSLPAPANLGDGTSGGENVVFTPENKGLPTVTATLGSTVGGKRDLNFTTNSLVHGEKYNYVINFKPANAPAFATSSSPITMPACSSKGAGYQMIGSWCAKVMTATQTTPLVITKLSVSNPEVNINEPADSGKPLNILVDALLKKAVETGNIPFASVASANGAKIFYPINGSLIGSYKAPGVSKSQTMVIDPNAPVNTLNASDYASVTAKMPAFVVKSSGIISSIQAPNLSDPAQRINVDKAVGAVRTCVTLAPGSAATEAPQTCPKLQ